jgi:hypothetical protein
MQFVGTNSKSKFQGWGLSIGPKTPLQMPLNYVVGVYLKVRSTWSGTLHTIYHLHND